MLSSWKNRDMNLLISAFFGPVLWALSKHIDKYLVERYFKKGNVAVLMVFTAIIGALALPFIWFFQPGAVAWVYNQWRSLQFREFFT
jgi:hypothetical protein